MSKLYKSPEVRTELRKLTERLRDAVPGMKLDHSVATSFGETYVLEMGSPSEETLVLLHGAMTNHAVVLTVMRHLSERYHLLIPDIPGHAGWSSESPPNALNDEHGLWLDEVLAALDVQRAHFFGLSYGAFVINRLIAVAPERIDRVFLMVPAGFVLMSPMAVARHLLFWVLLHAVTGKERFFLRILDAFFTQRPDVLMTRFFRLSLTGMRPISAKHKLVTAAETGKFTRPLYILGCENDIAVPPAELQKRAEQAYPHAQLEVLPGCKHTPPLGDATLLKLADRVSAFLSG